MTQPLPTPRNAEEEKVKRFLERGGKTTLEIRQAYRAPKVRRNTQAPVVVDIPGTEEFTSRVKGAGGDLDAHVRLDLAHQGEADLGFLIFVNTPDADGNTPITEPGFVGAVAFFGHHDGDRSAQFRLPVTSAVVKKKRAGAVQVTVVPVATPGSTAGPKPLEVSAAVELVLSQVTKNS